MKKYAGELGPVVFEFLLLGEFIALSFCIQIPFVRAGDGLGWRHPFCGSGMPVRRGARAAHF